MKNAKYVEVGKSKHRLLRDIWNSKYLYMLIIPFVIWMWVFCYGPMYGIVLAFKNYRANLGIMGSSWIGLKNFGRIFISEEVLYSIGITLLINIQSLIFVFPVPIIIAILLTEMPGKKVKKVYQTVMTFPHFLSWVVVSTILINVLSDYGAVNSLLELIGIDKIRFMSNKNLIRPLLHITQNWKEMGWGAIIYLAAISGIDPTLYEAAEIDGASRLKRIWHITLPGLRTIIAVQFVLNVGHIMGGGFDQIFNLRNAVVADKIRTLSVYIYDLTFGGVPDYGFSTAVGMSTSVVNVLMLILANKVVYWLTGDKMIQ